MDADGSAYVVGDTTSDDFPTASFQETFAGNVDGFLTKLTPDGTGIVYSTYLGGSAGGAVGRDKATDVAVDDQNCAYVVGVTGSDDFPLTPGVFQTQLDVADGFVAKFAADGQSQIYSTLIGGNNIDFANGIAIDRQGNAYVTGALSSGANVTFPTRNLIQDAPAGLTDSFVAKLNSDGSDLVYSTYLGGSSIDRATSIAVDGEGNAIVSGYTDSRNFPIVDPLPGVVADGSPMFFVTKFNATGSAHVYSTVLGGSGDDRSGAIPGGNSVAADRYGSASVIGSTSSPDFPIASFQEEYGGGQFDAAVAKISERFEECFAQVGNGGGLVSEPVVSNSSTGNWLSGSIQFTDDNADPLVFNLTVSGGEDVVIDGNVVHYNLPPLGSITMTSDGQGPVIPGAAKAEGNGKFGAVVRFTLPGIGTTGVAASQPLAGFISPVRRNPQGINTGIGIVSLADGLVDLELELRDQQGVILAMETIEDFGPCEHLAQFIDQLFAGVDTSDFQGSIVVRAIGGQVAATAIELGDDPGEFTTLPVTELN